MPLGSLSPKHRTHTHHHLHSSPPSSPQTRTARPGRSVGRKLPRWRWRACSPGAGSPSARTGRSSWSLQRRGAPRSGSTGPAQHPCALSTAGQHELPDPMCCSAALPSRVGTAAVTINMSTERTVHNACPRRKGRQRNRLLTFIPSAHTYEALHSACLTLTHRKEREQPCCYFLRLAVC